MSFYKSIECYIGYSSKNDIKSDRLYFRYLTVTPINSAGGMIRTRYYLLSIHNAVKVNISNWSNIFQFLNRF